MKAVCIRKHFLKAMENIGEGLGWAALIREAKSAECFWFYFNKSTRML
jgi:hypothetical protein